MLEAPDQPGADDASLVSAANLLKQGDSLLLAGNPDAALRQYRALVAPGAGEPPAVLRYRMALCAESLGSFGHAMEEYQLLVSELPSGALADAARLGLVRVWCKLGRSGLAKQMLWKALLNEAGEEATSHGIHTECAARLAQILAGQAREGMEPLLWMDRGITNPPVPWSPEQALRWASGREQTATAESGEEATAEETEPAARTPVGEPPSGPAPPTVEIVRQEGDGPAGICVDVQLPKMSVAAALELLLQKANLQLHWSDGAREAASERRVEIEISEEPLATILDGVLDPLDLLWEVSDQGLWVRSHEEVSAETLRQFRVALAERMLQRVISLSPDHQLADEAYWALGNLAFDREQLEAAAELYEQYLREFPRSRTKSGVHFNLGKIRLLQDQRDVAVQHFYHVVDDAVGEKTTTAAFLYLGRMFLEDGHASQAIKPLTRGLALAQGRAEKAVCAATLAAAYLLCDNPHAANQVLMEQRTALASDLYADGAAFLAALARFEATDDPKQIEAEGRLLIAALTHVKPGAFFGAQGFLLVARAYRNLEMLEDMQQVLLQGLGQPMPVGLRRNMLYELARSHRRSGERDKCRETLRSLLKDSDAEWARRARLELARVTFQAGDDAECLRACTQLLDATSADYTHREALRIMGRVLERQKNYHGAALCFAGIAPPPDAITSPETGQPK
jgi:tetratricopeptide (TPR) repeat protein